MQAIQVLLASPLVGGHISEPFLSVSAFTVICERLGLLFLLD